MTYVKQMLMLATIASATGAFAEDVHDYDGYVKLANVGTTSVTAGYPAADKWDPRGEMDASKCYLIQSGRTLTSATKNTAFGGTWPCAELAVQGTLSLTTSTSTDYAPTIAHLAIAAGGVLNIGGAFGSVKGDSLEIRGTSDNPSVINYSYSNASANSYHPYIFSELTGETDVVVKFTRSNSDGNDLRRAFRLNGGLGSFHGTLVVEGEHAWVRDTDAKSFDMDGTVELQNGGGLYIESKNPTFGGLILGNATTLQLVGGKTITVCGAFLISNDATLRVDKMSSTDFVYDNGSNAPAEIHFLSVCGADNAVKVDRGNLLNAVGRAGIVFKGGPSDGARRLALVEKTRIDGGVDFYVTHDRMTRQIKSCASGSGPYGYGQYADYLSDGKEISSERDYYSSMNIYFDAPYTFTGRSLLVAGLMGFYSGDVFSADNLTFLKGAWLRQMGKDGDAYLRGKACLTGGLECRVQGSKTMFIESALSGSGDLCIVYDIAKDVDKGSAPCGNIELRGDNVLWTGRTLVGCGREPVSGEVGLTNLTLRVSAQKNLGGDLDTFVFDSLKVSDLCTVFVTNTVTFAAKNRGWCLMDGSVVNVAANKTATIGEKVTFGSTVTKKGLGALVMGGEAKFYDAETDDAVGTPNGSILTVEDGSLGFAVTNALTGVSLRFKEGSSLLVDFSAAGDLQTFGAVGVSFASDAEAVKIPVSFTCEGVLPDAERAVAICTVQKALKDKISFVGPEHYSRRTVSFGCRENADDTVTFTATLSAKGGIILVFR